MQVTQNCNLRCKYCVYSGSYSNRVHSNKRMSFETAKSAIDFLYAHSSMTTLIIPELSEPPVRTLGATIPENESHIFR